MKKEQHQTKIYMNKKGLQFAKALYALIFISMSIIAVGAWIGEWNVTYDSGLTYDLEEFEKLDETTSIASNYKTNISARSSFDQSEAGDFEGTSLRGVFAVVNDIFDSFDVVFGRGGLLNSLEDRWGLPNYIITGTLAVMTIAMVFALVALFFRKGGGRA